jgi:hypothetical protein
LLVWLVGERDLPAEAGEFAGDGDGDRAGGLGAGVLVLAPAGVEASLRAPGDVDDLGWLAALAALELGADRRVVLVVVGGLDERAAGVGGAGRGDRALPALLPGGALGGTIPG